MKKILITWSQWMFAHDLISLIEKNWYKVFGVDKEECDITNQDSVRAVIKQFDPDLVINCAAYTAVDDAEDIWKELNYSVNVDWVKILAQVTSDANIPFVTVSTDYVFNGKKESWYLPDDAMDPINEYWKAKAQWEKKALKINQKSIVIRTSWLYGGGIWYKNFYNTMLSLSEKYDQLKVVNDQYWLPTYTVHLAQYLLHILKNIESYYWRVIHWCNSWKPTTWHWFTQEIMRVVKKEITINPCSSDEYPAKAERPQWSILLSEDETYTMPDWKQWVKEYACRVN